ncbi:hypothetical protein Tco_0010077 [Tanacetum coccineum]
MAPKRATRSTPGTENLTTTTVTNAQLQAMIDQGVTAALNCTLMQTENGDDSHFSGRVSEGERCSETVKEDDVRQYCPRGKFKRLSLKCGVEESDKVEKYVGGLPDMIHGSVMATKPKTMQDAIEFATELMNVAQAYAAGTGERKEYAGTLPLCNKCKEPSIGYDVGIKGITGVIAELKNRKTMGKLKLKGTKDVEWYNALEGGVGPFMVLEQVESVTYKLKLPQELSRVHNTFHVSNLKKCYSDDPLVIPLEGLQVDNKLHFVEEPVEIIDREVKQLRRSRVPIVKVRWNSRRGPEFTWEREDQFRKKYPHLFTKTAPSSSAVS